MNMDNKRQVTMWTKFVWLRMNPQWPARKHGDKK
jgi:hypothetical protein